MMDRIQKKCIVYRTSLNMKKTMVMKVANNAKDIPPTLTINVNGDRLKQVKEYNYLGSLIDEDMRSIGRGGSRKNSDILMTTPVVPRPEIYDYIYTYKHTYTKET